MVPLEIEIWCEFLLGVFHFHLQHKGETNYCIFLLFVFQRVPYHNHKEIILNSAAFMHKKLKSSTALITCKNEAPLKHRTLRTSLHTCSPYLASMTVTIPAGPTEQKIISERNVALETLLLCWSGTKQQRAESLNVCVWGEGIFLNSIESTNDNMCYFYKLNRQHKLLVKK